MNGISHGRVSTRGTRFGRGVLFGSFGASTAPVGTPPTDVTLSASSILETALPNTIVATISSNGDAPWLFSIVDDPDSKFRIVGSNLVLDQPLDYETATSHNVTIRAANLGGFHDKELTISVIDVVEAVAPTVVNLSTASVLESAGIGAVVATISSDGTAPVTYTIESDPDGKFRIEGNALELAATIDFATDNEHPVTIRATNAVGFEVGAFTISVTQVVSGAIETGFLADRDEGTDGDLFVDRVNGLPGNDGLTVATALSSVQASLDLAQPGDVVKIRNVDGSKYRESIVPPSGSPGQRVTLSGYGTEKPVITAAEALTDAVACTQADEDVVGANYGQMYKVVGLAKTDIASDDPRAAFLFENDVPMRPCMGRRPNPQYPHTERATKDWLDADEMVTTGAAPNILIEGHRKPSFTDRFTKAQLENCDILFHRYPNGDTRAEVLSFDEATKTIYFDQTGITDIRRTLESNPYKHRFILVNLLPMMRRGEWGFVDNGATVDIYFWPSDVGNVNVNIEYSRRGYCVDVTGKSHLNFKSVILERSSSAGDKNDGHYAFNAGNSVGASPYATDIELDNVWVRDTYRSESSYAPIWMRNVNNFKVSQSTVSDAVNQFGIQATGPFWNEYDSSPTGAWIDRCVVLRADQSPIRLYGLKDFIVSRGHYVNCGQAAHANKGNIYGGGHNGLWIHNYWWACPGYWTFQRSSGQFFVFNFIHGNTLDADGRAIEDQNYDNTTDIPQLSPATGQGIIGDTYVLNNTVVPWRNAATYPTAVILGSLAEIWIEFASMNNIMNGAGYVAEKLIPGGVKNNVHTQQAPYDLSDSLVPFDQVYEDLIKGDVAFRVDSPTLSLTGHAIDILPGTGGPVTLAGQFPAYDGFGLDIAGNPINFASPPVGAVANPANLHRFDPVWVVRPKLLNAPVVGGSVTADAGYIMAAGHTAMTYQWYLVDDVYDPREDWSPVGGADAAAYAPVAGDVGKYLARRTVMEGVDEWSLMTVPVVATYPVETPTVLHEYQNSTLGVTGWTDTGTFTPTGKPLIVIFTTLNIPLAESTITATIGAPGRSLGTGSAVPVKAKVSIRTRNQQAFAFIADPGTDDVSIQFESASGQNAVAVTVLQAGGLSDIILGEVVGDSASATLATKITSTSEYSGILHSVCRYDGDLTEDITWAGASEIFQGNTGDAETSADLAFSLAYVQGAPIEEYAATASWTDDHTVTIVSIELVADAAPPVVVTDIMAGYGDFADPLLWTIVKTEASVVDNVARFAGTTQSFTRIEITGPDRRPVTPGTVLDLSFDIPRMDAEGRLWINVKPFNSSGQSLGGSVTIYDSNAEGIFTVPETRTKLGAYTVPADAVTLEVSLNCVDIGSDYDIDNLMLTY